MVFLLGSEFDVSSLSRILQSCPAVIARRLYISTVFEQQAHNLQRLLNVVKCNGISPTILPQISHEQSSARQRIELADGLLVEIMQLHLRF